MDPVFSKITSIILPSAETMGLTWAFLPEITETSGNLLKLIISLVPYPDPLSDKCTDVSSPLKIGWTSALYALDSIPGTVAMPTGPSTTTDIGG